MRHFTSTKDRENGDRTANYPTTKNKSWGEVLEKCIAQNAAQFVLYNALTTHVAAYRKARNAFNYGNLFIYP